MAPALNTSIIDVIKINETSANPVYKLYLLLVLIPKYINNVVSKATAIDIGIHIQGYVEYKVGNNKGRKVESPRIPNPAAAAV